MLFENFKGKAVVLRGYGISPLCLAKAKYNPSRHLWEPRHDLQLCLKNFYVWPRRKECIDFAKDLKWKQNMIVKFGNRFGRGNALRWDLRYDYFLCPNWSDEEVYRIVTSCMGPKHIWKDGWVCDHCGKMKADIEEFKKSIEENYP